MQQKYRSLHFFNKPGSLPLQGLPILFPLMKAFLPHNTQPSSLNLKCPFPDPAYYTSPNMLHFPFVPLIIYYLSIPIKPYEPREQGLCVVHPRIPYV